MSKSIPAGVEHKAIPFEVKEVGDDGHGSFSGVGAAFNNLDGGGDIIAPGAFAKGLAKFLTDGFVGGIDHNWTGAIGHPMSAEETPEGLLIKAVFDDTPDAQAARAKMTPNPLTGRATIRKLSIGYRANEAKRLGGLDEVKSYWQSVGYQPTPRDVERAAKGARLLTDLALYEVSPVIVPMNDMAGVHNVKSAEPAGFDEQMESVEQAVSEAVDRANERHAARTKAGRVLSESNRTRLRALVGSLQSAMADIEALLAATEPAQKGGESHALPEEPTPVVVPAIDDGDLFAQYALTMHATNPDFL